MGPVLLLQLFKVGLLYMRLNQEIGMILIHGLFLRGGNAFTFIPDKTFKVIIDGFEVTIDTDAVSGDIKLVSDSGNLSELSVTSGILTVYGQVELMQTTGSDLVKLTVLPAGSIRCIENE